MTFLKSFKDTVEKKMSEAEDKLVDVEGGINKKLESFALDSARKEEKQDTVNKKLENHLNKMEEDEMPKI